jgi:hypothetical protein
MELWLVCDRPILYDINGVLHRACVAFAGVIDIFPTITLWGTPEDTPPHSEKQSFDSFTR